MLLTVDIGNTNLTLAIMNDSKVLATYRLTTTLKRTSDEYGMHIVNMLNIHNLKKEDIEGIIISSVVPKLMHSFTNAIRKYLDKEPMIVGPGIKSGISIRYDNPKEVGADRIVDAVAAHKYYGGDILVIDFGTATTFEYIDANANYYGGCICPGIEIAGQALSNMAAKLPDIEIKPTQKIISSDTIGAMQAGLFHGYVGQVEHIIEMFKKETGKELKVIATGGLGKQITKATDKIDIYDGELAYKGLEIIYKKNK
ncbi:MAG: type III pantothenate kinase [Erysipelotrichaceae bacterium]|nr:type III pantothenate kinase [Erysipelotrichaceae bacterium]